MLRVQLISIIVYAGFAWMYVVPWLKKVGKIEGLTALLWVHVFRYCVLYLPVAQREGYPISHTALLEVVVGDLSGAVLAAIAIIVLRLNKSLGLVATGLVIIASVADVAGGFYIRSLEPHRPDAAGVWWMIFVFFAPLVVVTLPLIVWQLFWNRSEPLKP